MTNLEDLLEHRPDLTLDELVTTANELLPHYLPEDVADARIKGEVNPRLVRHYTSEGLLENPLKLGREARYTVDHLLQLLALRRLLADGVSATTIGDTLLRKDRNELRALLEGGAQLEVAPTTDPREGALDFLANIRQRTQSDGQPSAPPTTPTTRPPTPPPVSGPRKTTAPKASAWERFEMLDGVELHVRNDVRVPSSPAAQQRLLDHILALLIQIAQRRMR